MKTKLLPSTLVIYMFGWLGISFAIYASIIGKPGPTWSLQDAMVATLIFTGGALVLLVTNFGPARRESKGFAEFFGFQAPHPDDTVARQHLTPAVNDVLKLLATFYKIAEENRTSLRVKICGPTFAPCLTALPVLIKIRFNSWYEVHESDLLKKAKKCFETGVRLAGLASFTVEKDIRKYEFGTVPAKAGTEVFPEIPNQLVG